ncbi:hypothetical protein F4775DRAFT_415882 [Biscogniauxia sp. FL1348]|nr:hypothetical protein F4775DRAFT_415882 [Biscogniauxia sp. FL1348]
MRPLTPTLLLALSFPLPASASSQSPLPEMPRRGPFPWTNPFNRTAGFASVCTAAANFSANEYLLDDLPDAPPKGLGPYAAGLKRAFDGRRYPGSWEGYEPVGIDRKMLEMRYADVPARVREWWVEQGGVSGKEKTDDADRPVLALFRRSRQIQPEGVWVKETVTVEPRQASDLPGQGQEEQVDDEMVVIFAPGVLYPILPLWVAEGSECESTLLDLTRYSHELVDGGVVAWITKHTKARRAKGRRDVIFTIEARVLKNVSAEEESVEKGHERDEL